MHYYLVATTIIAQKNQSSFTYHSADALAAGCLVQIEVGKRAAVGVIVASVAKPPFKTKPIAATLEAVPLPARLTALAGWMASYYAAHEAMVWQTILPSAPATKRRKVQKVTTQPQRKRTTFVLNKQQKAAVATIIKPATKTALLHGVTGSGKTRVYIEVAKKLMAHGKSTIIIVPEIALTTQLVAEFTNHFPRVLTTHSTMSSSQRHQIWKECLHATDPLVVIGPRSALFSPLRDVGLIVIDECHEPSLKQDKSPRYSALRVASMLGKLSGAKVIFGSATPSIVDYFIATKQAVPIINLPVPARSDAKKPGLHIVDMTSKQHFSRHRFLSNQLLEALQKTLASGKQSLIFHNRRGSAPTTMCQKCGWHAVCSKCHLPMTLHADQFTLRCHLCGTHRPIPTSCPDCKNTSIIHKGLGTKLIAEQLAKQFPAARVQRFDGDNSKAESLDALYEQLYKGTVDIIVGTQVVAKGLDLPHLRTVGIIQADNGLIIPDFQSSERVFQLIAQVGGRVGRSKHASTIVIQSYLPNHPSVTYGLHADYTNFYAGEIATRCHGAFPPFNYLLKVVCSYKTEAHAITASKKLVAKLRSVAHPQLTIFGPAPSFYERLGGNYRWQIIARSKTRSDLLRLMDYIPPSHWQAEIDPISLL